MVDKFVDRVTIYNDIPATGENTRIFNRFVIDKCLIYNRLTESAQDTVQTVVNVQNVITKDTEHYKMPLEYMSLDDAEKANFYTVQVDDFIVFGEVADVVTTGKEFQKLVDKYAGQGMLVTAVNANLSGMIVNNVQIVGGGS